MKESIGSTASLNIIFAFIAIVFAFLAASLSYYKAFKVNNIITNSIEKFEGVNSLSISQINKKLNSIGYQRFSVDCASNKTIDGREFSLVDGENIDGVCIYIYDNLENNYYQYGIVTYMTINLPIINELVKIPVNTITNEIYRCYSSFSCN